MDVPLLRYVALTTGLHADALRCHVTENKRVLQQVQADDRRMSELEEQLNIAAATARRVASAGTAIIASRKDHPRGEPKNSAPPAPVQRSTGGGRDLRSISDVLKFAALAEDFSSEGDAHRATSSMQPDEAIRSAEGALARVELEMRRCEQMSVQFKLRQLEAAKAAFTARGVRRGDLIKESENFKFSTEVEELWNADNVGTSLATPASSGECDTDDDADSEPASFFATILNSAVSRLKMRYIDAINVLSCVELDESEFSQVDEAHARRHCSAAVYAHHLTSPDTNEDLKNILDVESLTADSLPNYYSKLCDKYVTNSVDDLMDQEENSGRASDKHSSILNASHYLFLPKEWRCSDVIHPSKLETLPPAKHIFARRFTFSNAQELLSLEKLRVELQTTIMFNVLFCDSEEASRWVRDPGEARLVQGLQDIAHKRGRGQSTWHVLARTEPNFFDDAGA